MSKLKFSLELFIQEEHKKSIYCIKFCSILPSYSAYFASVGHNSATIYKISDNGSVEPLQNYTDSDNGESLYTCTWAHSGQGIPLLVVAGVRGILKVINAQTFELEATLRGHGHDIDDLAVHPVDLNLVLSASKDESIRLWNIRTSICIAIFGGERAHRDDVLSIDVHPLGNCFVSGGMDTSIKVWNLASPLLQRAVADSYSDPSVTSVPFQTVFEQIPLFSTTQLHKDYVDTVVWVGNLILSKSTSNRAALWAPDPERYAGATCVLREFRLTDCQIWYVRFGVSIPLDLLAVGNTKGKVCIYRLSPDDDELQQLLTSPTPTPTPSGSDVSVGGYGAEGSESEGETHGSGGLQEEGNTSGGSASAGRGFVAEHDDVYASEQVESFKNERYECGMGTLPAAVLTHDDAYGHCVRHISFSPDCRHVVYGCDSGKIFVWRIEREVACLPTTSSA